MEIDSNIVIVRDFNTPLSPMDKSSKMKINKETQALNDTLKKMALGFPGGAAVGSPPANAGDTSSCPGPEGSHMPRSG